MRNDVVQQIVTQCLGGRALPRSLRVLWDAREAGDAALADVFRIESLLTDLQPLDAGYGEAIARESPDIAANVTAHRKLFEQLGFFAEIEDGELLAYWLGDASEEPPVVKLDSEGQYSWQGGNLAEALFRLAEGRAAEAARAWLTARDLDPGPLGELGATTQFLPDLGDLQKRMYYANVGKPLAARAMVAEPAHARDPATWLRRPGVEVKSVLTRLMGKAPEHYCTWCDGDGLVTTVKLDDRTKTGAILGIAVGASKAEVEAALGAPQKTGMNWVRYLRGARAYRYGFDKEGVVRSITLSLGEGS